MINIAVVGACGKMGKTTVEYIIKMPEFNLICAIDKYAHSEKINDIVIENDIKTALENKNIDVAIDFTQPSTVFENIKIYQNLKIKSVIGTTGLTVEQIEDIKKMSKDNNTGIIIAPNFSIGAILMMKYAQDAAKYFSNAEIIEFHHNQKKDAPSGTSIKTAELMMKNNTNFKLGNCEEKETLKGARGAESGNIQIHSVRMPGFVASQEVIFGSDGQTLKIHHDTINRECYMSGVGLAVKHVFENNEFIYGLENIL